VGTLTKLGGMFAGAEETSREFARRYRHFAGWAGLPWFDAGSVIRSSDIDGIHLEAGQHRLLGEALAGEVRRVLATA
ncbi:MAG: hydrolase, partial [Chloroflexota bacterium]|nr:hydrolase [Chloroflexota bacterium]